MSSRYRAWAARWRVPLGFALVAAYLVFSQPTRALLWAGGAVAGVGLALRAIAAGYLDKNASLATAGPYAYTRNPLYLGSFLLGLGFALAGGSWVLGLAFLVLFFAIYWPVIRYEEESLAHQFEETYKRYAAVVPLLIPNGRRAPSSGEKFRWERYRRNREYEAALGVLAGLVFLALKLALK